MWKSMDSDYPFGIFKLFSDHKVIKLFLMCFIKLTLNNSMWKSMDSDYPFGIFKLFSDHKVIKLFLMCFIKLTLNNSMWKSMLHGCTNNCHMECVE